MDFKLHPGYFISHVGFRSSGFEKVFFLGGTCEVAGAVSPNSGKRLTQYAKINFPCLELSTSGWKNSSIHFLYSWHCHIHEGNFSYKYEGENLKIVEFTPGSISTTDFPYLNYPQEFRLVPMGLEPISETDQKIIVELNKNATHKFENDRAAELSVPTHQLGGIPYLLNAEESIRICPLCSKQIPILATIANTNYSSSEGFFGNDFVQLVYWFCAGCQLISVSNYCD